MFSIGISDVTLEIQFSTISLTRHWQFVWTWWTAVNSANSYPIPARGNKARIVLLGFPGIILVKYFSLLDGPSNGGSCGSFEGLCRGIFLGNQKTHLVGVCVDSRPPIYHIQQSRSRTRK